MQILRCFLGGLQSGGGKYSESMAITSSINLSLSLQYLSLRRYSLVFCLRPVLLSQTGSGDGDLISASFCSQSQAQIRACRSSIRCLRIQTSIYLWLMLRGKYEKHCGVKVFKLASPQPLRFKRSSGSSQRAIRISLGLQQRSLVYESMFSLETGNSLSSSQATIATGSFSSCFSVVFSGSITSGAGGKAMAGIAKAIAVSPLLVCAIISQKLLKLN